MLYVRHLRFHRPIVAMMILCIGLGTSSPCQGQEPTKLVVPHDSFAFMTIRVDRLIEIPTLKPLLMATDEGAESPLKSFEKEIGISLSDVERLTILFPQLTEEMDSAVVTVSMKQPIEEKTLLTRMRAYSPRQQERGYRPVAPDEASEFSPEAGAVYYHPGGADDFVMFILDDKTLMFLGVSRHDPTGGIALLGQLARRAKVGALSDAINIIDDHLIVVGVNVPQINTILPEPLPLELKALQPLLKAKSATLTLDIDAEFQVKGTLRFPDGKMSEDGLRVLKFLQTLAQQQVAEFKKEMATLPEKENREILSTLMSRVETAITQATLDTDNADVRLQMSMPADNTLALAVKAATIQMGQAQKRVVSQNNLKQIGLALHNYHDTVGTFPASDAPSAIPISGAKPLLSWRVAILPFIGQDNLYRQFNHSEPWDSEHNLKLLKQMPQLYTIPNRPTDKPGMTYIQGFVGEHAVFLPGPRGRALLSITDGTSNTLMVVEGDEAVPWTKPADIPFDDKNVPKLIGTQGGFNGLMTDGSVRFFRTPIDPEMLRRLIHASDGEIVDFEKVK